VRLFSGNANAKAQAGAQHEDYQMSTNAGARLALKPLVSPCCGAKLDHYHLRALALRKHKPGSEHHMCTKCYRAYYKDEGATFGLPYFLD
jgi:hypothetical protein